MAGAGAAPRSARASATDGPRRSGLLQERSRQTRRDLVRAALQLWSERGFERGVEETTVEEIARAAGVTKGTFYFHFARKEDILRELGWGASASMRADAEGAMAKDQPTTEALEALLQPLARRVAKVDRAAVRRSIAEFHRASPPALAEATATVTDEGHGGFTAAFAQIVAYGKERGELPAAVDVAEIAGLLTAVTMDAIQSWTLGITKDLGAVMVRRAQLVLAGAAALPAS